MPRGRPKKTPISREESPDLAESPKTPAPPASRGRGRPPKNPPKEKAEATPKVKFETSEEIEEEYRAELEAEELETSSNPEVLDDPEVLDPEVIASLNPSPEAPSPIKRGRGRPKKVTSDTPGSASSATNTPAKGKAYIPTGRPRGRPPKSGKPSSSGTLAAEIPTSRGRGRPPKTSASNSPAPTATTKKPTPPPFALRNLVGYYRLKSPSLAQNFRGRKWGRDGEERFLEISLDPTNFDLLIGEIYFDSFRGRLNLALSKAQLEEQIGEAPPESPQLELVASDLYDNDDNTSGDAGPSKGNDGNQGEADNDIKNSAGDKGKGKAVDRPGNDGAIDKGKGKAVDRPENEGAGEKRKAVADPEPVKRGRGRPPKKKKIDRSFSPLVLVRTPTPEDQVTVYFAYYDKRHEDSGEEEGPFFGKIVAQDNTCDTLNGVFDQFPQYRGKIANPPVAFVAEKEKSRENSFEQVINFGFEE